MYDAILARSFGKHEHKKIGVCAFVGCFVMTLGFCIILPYDFTPLLSLNWQLTRSINSTVFLSTLDTSAKPQQSVSLQQVKKFKPSLPPTICNFSEPRTDFCEINTETRIQGNSSTVFFMSSNPIKNTATPLARNTTAAAASSYSIKPYARKTDRTAMSKVKEWSLKPAYSNQRFPPCTKTHDVPAIVFSLGAYTGNHFHDFSDVMIPLYVTSRQFDGQVQFLVSNYKPWWFRKFSVLLKSLSEYEIVDMDHDREVHCFPRTIVGLKSYKELSIDPSRSPNGYSMRNFTQFLRESYSLQRDTLQPLIGGNGSANTTRKPRLLIVSRKRSRAFLNEDEVAAEARSLGYDVVIADATTNLARFSAMVNSFDVFMGVHGAGLTNSVFLPENAILIQVIPLGLEWLGKTDFELPARDMNLRYLEYRISKKESSLIEKYGLDHPLVNDPSSMKKQGWGAFRSVYLVSQNVKLDVNRFRVTLLKALELLHQ